MINPTPNDIGRAVIHREPGGYAEFGIVTDIKGHEVLVRMAGDPEDKPCSVLHLWWKDGER